MDTITRDILRRNLERKVHFANIALTKWYREGTLRKVKDILEVVTPGMLRDGVDMNHELTLEDFSNDTIEFLTIRNKGVA